MADYNEIITVDEPENNALMELDYDNILNLADRADRMVDAMNKIMHAAIKITTARDWVLIGDGVYLQDEAVQGDSVTAIRRWN